MLIAERFVLLMLDPSSGRVAAPRRSEDIDLLCAAALLLDLAAQQRLSGHLPDRLQIDARLPSNHTLLTAAADALAALPHPSSKEALHQVERRLVPLAHRVREGLVRRDLLHRVRDWRFWLGATLHYPLRSWQARNEAVVYLQQASTGHGGVGALGLLILIDAAGLTPAYLDAHQYERANRLLLGLGDGASDDSQHAALALIRNALAA